MLPVPLIFIILFGEALSDFIKLDPDIFRTTTEMIESRGFKSETYHVATGDGYILTVFRIINPFVKSASKPVIIWHGDGETSDVWLMSRSGQLNSSGMYTENEGSVINDCKGNLTNTLGFTLSACGYDVWLPNTRGNIYSDRHIYLNISDPEFFDFTVTEKALYDVPAVVSMILNETNMESLVYIGFSGSSAQMTALLSLRPEFEKYIEPYISLGTAVGHIHTSYQLLQDLAAFLEPLVRQTIGSIGFDRYLAQNVSIILTRNREFSDAIAVLWELIWNDDLEQLDFERFPMYFGKVFSRDSYRAFIGHLTSQGQHGFRMFDYGPEDNTAIYHQAQAPFYPIENIRSKNIAIIYGERDTSSPLDLMIFRDRLKVPLLAFKKIPWPNWVHFDNVWAIQANIYLNPIILSLLK